MLPSEFTENLDDQAKAQLGRLREGCVLLSKEGLADPNFASTVVLICVHNADGAYGLVLNRPAHMPLSEVFDLDAPERDKARKIYMGGPVSQESLQLLQRTDTPMSGAYEVASGVYLGGDWGSLEQILEADEEITRLFLGYSGWGAGQLESEIGQGVWEVHGLDVAKLIENPEDPLFGSIDEIRGYLQGLNQQT